jgi:CubicO group peptidase (beta-lactamase class C family)
VAWKLGGIAGNAGLFSTAADLGRFAAMVASGGMLDGVRVLRPDLARALVTQQPHAGRRTLGWDAFCPAEPPVASLPCLHPAAYGHYGWTGTSLWVDPARGLWVVLLANRSYDVLKPKSMDSVRQGVFAALEGPGAAPPAPGAVAAAADSAGGESGAPAGRSLLAQEPPLHAPAGAGAAPVEANPGH